MTIFENYESGNYDAISGLTKELKVQFIVEKFNKKNENILIVTNSLYEANQYYQMLSSYTKKVLFFPMDDFLTSEALAISPEMKTTRLETLQNIKKGTNIVVTNLTGYLRFLPSRKTFNSSNITLIINQEIKMDELIKELYRYGYTKETTINKTGEIAVRGFVIDIFPISEENPIRIEFWGEQIESIRYFNVDNQLTLKNVTEITINPYTELLLSNENIDTFELKQKDIIKYDKPSNITDYLEECLVIFDDYERIKINYNELVEEMFNYSLSIDLNPKTEYMHDFTKIKTNKDLKLIELEDNLENYENIYSINAKEIEPFTNNIDEVNRRLNQYLAKKNKVIICLSNHNQVNKLLTELNNENIVFTDEVHFIENKINLIIKKINNGFQIDKNIIISDKDIFNHQEHKQVYKTSFKIGTKIKDINKLEIGDYVVHNVYGIGRYLGIVTLTKNGLEKDYLHIEYRDGDKLYIPVEKIDLITKYASKNGGIPRLNKLGTLEWEKTKLKAKQRIESIANELLLLYAQREASKGFAFHADTIEQLEFEKEFIYEETKDQIRVINEIKADMEKIQPMDRLLCGDVGYGKTEVAFRAIFKAILSGKQVAFLCPTTILSSQHYKNAIERFSSFPVNISLLNRFVSAKETTKILNNLKEGKLDLLIGTHRILSDDIEFKDLGLLIIDEEQRFGVKHKEKIKSYKNNVDILTLSATPIPRTMQMTMSGLRTLSLIETPPVNRYPIQTYVLKHNNQIIKDAIYKELSRNGQVFVLYNKVEDITEKVKTIQELVKEAKVIYAHGQMTKHQLENIMNDFVNHKYDVLVCTTIIETGIDIPNVNTLIIDNADYFGLSQLYQIRGRVGRSNKIAKCYLMYNPEKNLSETAIKRLKAIKEFTELGSGFAIAMRDLAIRGAGDILGSEQAGFIDTIGIELFMEMLNKEVQRLKGEKIEEENDKNIPLIEVATSINNNYVIEEDLKIEIHKKINSIDSKEKLNEIKIELEDRFGKITEEMLIYMHQEWFEKIATKVGIKKINQTRNFIELTLDESLTEKIDGRTLFFEITDISKMFRLKSKNKKIIIILDTVKLEKHFIYYLIELVELIKKATK